MSLSLAPALAASAVSFLKISSKQTGSPEVMHLIAISNQAMALIFHTRGVPGPCRRCSDCLPYLVEARPLFPQPGNLVAADIDHPPPSCAQSFYFLLGRIKDINCV
jgi:hypothetical protein